MATSTLADDNDVFEESPQTVLLPESGAVQRRRRGGIDRCFVWINALLGLAFAVLGAWVFVEALIASRKPYTGPYISGGLSQFVLGLGVLVYLVLQCFKFPGVSLSPRTASDATSCMLFTALTVLFLLWVSAACSFLASLILISLHSDKDRWRITALIFSCISLLLEFIFGGSVCMWGRCAVD